MKRPYLALIALVLAGGCYVGKRAPLPSIATQPIATEVKLTVREGDIVGELLSVEADALVLRTEDPRRIIRVPVSAIQSGSAFPVGSFGSNLSGADQRRLQQVSRFPQGISAELEAALLRSHGLTAIERIGQ